MTAAATKPASLSIASRWKLLKWAVGYTYTFIRNIILDPLNRQDNYRGPEVFKLVAHGLLGRAQYQTITHDSLSRTSRLMPEGAGSQALRKVLAMEFARQQGLTYIHTPLKVVGHADRPMVEWVRAWVQHFNLGLGERMADNFRSDSPVLNFDVIYSWSMFELFGLTFEPDISEAMVGELRQKYYHDKAPRNAQQIVVCAHFRRGDVNPETYPDMWVETGTTARTIEAVRTILLQAGLPFSIHLYSQGPLEDLGALADLDVTYHWHDDALTTFTDFVEADILIMSKSLFSYHAALLSEGIKLAQPFFVPRDDWILCDSTGEFDHRAVQQRLAANSPGIG